MQGNLKDGFSFRVVIDANFTQQSSQFYRKDWVLPDII